MKYFLNVIYVLVFCRYFFETFLLSNHKTRGNILWKINRCIRINIYQTITYQHKKLETVKKLFIQNYHIWFISFPVVIWLMKKMSSSKIFQCYLQCCNLILILILSNDKMKLIMLYSAGVVGFVLLKLFYLQEKRVLRENTLYLNIDYIDFIWKPFWTWFEPNVIR